MAKKKFYHVYTVKSAPLLVKHQLIARTANAICIYMDLFLFALQTVHFSFKQSFCFHHRCKFNKCFAVSCRGFNSLRYLKYVYSVMHIPTPPFCVVSQRKGEER